LEQERLNKQFAVRWYTSILDYGGSEDNSGSVYLNLFVLYMEKVGKLGDLKVKAVGTESSASPVNTGNTVSTAFDSFVFPYLVEFA
jgi:hypothetical protein